MKDNKSLIAKRFVNEKVEGHWAVNKDPKSFDELQHHLINTTNMFSFFYKAISKVLDFYNPEGLIIADIGGGVGWTSAILGSFPQIKKIYLIDPSIARLEKAKYIIDHYDVDQSKIIIIEGDFLNFNLPEKVDIAILNGSFHHCFDKDISELFEQIRKNLKEPKKTKYINYKGEEKLITQKSQILISGEHYINNIRLFKRFILLILSFFYIIKPKKDINDNFYKLDNLNPPNFFSGEHERSKREIIKLFQKNNFKFKLYEYDEDNLKKKNKLLRFYRRPLTYFYAILK